MFMCATGQRLSCVLLAVLQRAAGPKLCVLLAVLWLKHHRDSTVHRSGSTVVFVLHVDRFCTVLLCAEAPSERTRCHRVFHTAFECRTWCTRARVIRPVTCDCHSLCDMRNASVDARFDRVSTIHADVISSVFAPVASDAISSVIGIRGDRSEENPPAGLLHESHMTQTQALLIQMQTPDQGDVNSHCTALQQQKDCDT